MCTSTSRKPTHLCIYDSECRFAWPLDLGLALEYFHTLSNVMECLVVHNVQTETTFNNGSLGSRIDEERSEMR
jgi:hypothetical protein